MKKQAGFALVEIVGVMLLVSLIAGVGWYVWQANKDEASDSPAAQTSVTEPQKPDSSNSEDEGVDVYEGWLTYTSITDSGLSFRYPADWQITEPESVFTNVDGGESSSIFFRSTEPIRGAASEQALAPASATNLYMCVDIVESRGAWQRPNAIGPQPSNKEAVAIGDTKATLATYSNEVSILSRLELIDESDDFFELSAANDWKVTASAHFNCIQADNENFKQSTEVFEDRPEVETAKLILKSITF